MSLDTSQQAPPRPVTPLGIAAARLASLRRDLEALYDVDPALLGELDEVLEIVGGLDAYVETCTTSASAALDRVEAATGGQDWSTAASLVPLEQEMISGQVEGRFLEFLVHLSGARQVLEIGLFTGYSALAMAEALRPGGRLVACELDPGVAGLARDLLDASPAGHLVEIEVGPALETLGVLAARGEVFDLVFLDADKTGYGAYLDALLDGPLLAPGAVVAVDNTLLQGEPWSTTRTSANGAAIAAFNARVAADPRLVQVLVPLRDGVTLLRRA